MNNYCSRNVEDLKVDEVKKIYKTINNDDIDKFILWISNDTRVSVQKLYSKAVNKKMALTHVLTCNLHMQ